MSPKQIPGTYPNGVHVAEVEIDPDTGLTRTVKYTAVNDFGTVLNPMLVEGQIQGGVVQGLGQVLLEGAVYDADGQLVTGSFMDYAMPHAHDAPMIDVANRPVPTKTNPIGAKGCGEAGTSGGLPAVANAVIHALSDYAIRHLEMPMTPSRIWQAIEDAKGQASLLPNEQTRAAVTGGPCSMLLVPRLSDRQAGPGSFTFFSGSERTRVPVAAKIALHTAGAIGGVAGSPMPPQRLPPESARWVSIRGASAIFSMG